jgi:hypothetical protein
LKTPEAVNRTTTGNTMTEKTRTKGTTMMYKILHRKWKIEQTNSNKNSIFKEQNK